MRFHESNETAHEKTDFAHNKQFALKLLAPYRNSKNHVIWFWNLRSFFTILVLGHLLLDPRQWAIMAPGILIVSAGFAWSQQTRKGFIDVL